MRQNNLKPAFIGKDGRTSAIQKSLSRSTRVAGEPVRLSEGKPEKADALRLAKQIKPDFVIIGPEVPLAEGIVDDLEGLGIPCIGPTRSLARLESSKAFTRQLLSKHNIPGNPEYRVFKSIGSVEAYLRELGDFVVKPDGLTGGKGVKISGAHLHSIAEAVDYCAQLFKERAPAVVIEEKLDGEEFSLQSFCSGTQVKDMVVVQDHKRAGEGDTGPNTGGMGSYSDENLSLPFLLPQHLEFASAINKAVAEALFAETGQKYRGILYGGFMVTRKGIRLLEYNARFGDPEALNVLSLLRTDLVDICEAIIEEKLNELPIIFEKRATVCKYVVPEGYPENPVRGKLLDMTKVPQESDNLKVYRAGVDETGGRLYLSGSRAIAFVGIGKDLDEAQAIAEEAASAVHGPVFHRRDIGTYDLIQQRVRHVRSLCEVPPAPALNGG
ncbi:MAG TPA: phosphoribosylamine--glycine ligase [Verrucomicrobiae bacterium]|nr:phosphoribosylamine--glycine ligase [Verrucomicrobiae bacterium]